jgi:hypothetical protein
MTPFGNIAYQNKRGGMQCQGGQSISNQTREESSPWNLLQLYVAWCLPGKKKLRLLAGEVFVLELIFPLNRMEENLVGTLLPGEFLFGTTLPFKDTGT